jgi:hypothetical protein
MGTETLPVPPPGMTMIENVSLEKFEQAVYRRDYEEASGLLLVNLRKFKTGARFIGYGDSPELLKLLYTRFCAAVISLLADPKFEVSQHGFDLLASEHAVIDLLFRASAFETSDHLLALGAIKSDVSIQHIRIESGPALAKFLLTYSLVSALQMDFEKTLSMDPQISLGLYAGMLSPLLVIHPEAHNRRESLLAIHHIFKDCKLPDEIMPTLCDAYMYTSYGTRPDKHDAKAMIHGLFARLVADNNIALPTFDHVERKERPTILICLDWFNSAHAMFRCYAPIIRQLRARFRLVAMSAPGSIDEEGKAEFDEWFPVSIEKVILSEVVDKILEIAPDIIYYPSVGMSPWWVATASVRLAPVQVITLGHPATTRSPAIDYVLCDEGSIGDPALFSEEIVTYPNGSARYVMRNDADLPEPVIEEAEPAVVKIAVPAMLCKLNAKFMHALKEIRKRSTKPLEFHFFVNMLGVNLNQASTEIRAWLPESKVYERRHYNQYMRELRECHIHLSTFPFGGTNSNIDSLLMGLPIVTMWGDEPHARFDGMMIRRAQLPEFLIAADAEQYIAAALRLIEEPGLRLELKSHLLQFDLQGEFFGEPPDNTAFLRAMESVYERQFSRPGSDEAPSRSESANRDGCGGAGPGDGLVPGASQDDRTEPHAQGVGADHGLPAEARP